MSVGVALEELLAWNDEGAKFWKERLGANPALLELPCDIGGAANVQGLIRHAWGAELRWAQRLDGQTPLDWKKMPADPLDALFDLHSQALVIFRSLLAAPEERWSEPYILEFAAIPAERRSVSRRKIAAHMLVHSQRHYAQLATVVRTAGFPSDFRGDLLFSLALG